MRSPSTGRVEVPFSARFHSARSGRNPDGRLVEGLRMGQPAGRVPSAGRVTGPNTGEVSATGGVPGRSFAHVPVMVTEVVGFLTPVPPGVVLDATLGGAGHTRAILDAAPQVSVVGLDQDPDAIEAARRTLQPYGPRATVVRTRFDRLGEVLDGVGIAKISGALFDLGVSSPQFDRPERGFSYRQPGPLDMRMDPGASRSAADVVNQWSERDLVSLLQANGEGRFARRIARAIVAARPIVDTAELADTVKQAIPAAARRTGGHPARRMFQAVRIAVNEELGILPGSLDAAIDRLDPGGRCVVLSYHSGEDRIVKDRFRHAATGGCVCPPGMPCVCGATPSVRLLTRGARRPSPDEVAANRRAESARLRVVERISPNAESSGTHS